MSISHDHRFVDRKKHYRAIEKSHLSQLFNVIYNVILLSLSQLKRDLQYLYICNTNPVERRVLVHFSFVFKH